MRAKITGAALLCCLLWLDSYGGTDEASKINDVLNSKQEEALLIRAFGGMLELPDGMYFDSRFLLTGSVKFTNHAMVEDGVDIPDFPEFNVIVRVGMLDDPTLRLAEASDYSFSCYGFNQAVTVSEMADGSLIATVVLFDDEIQITITSDNLDVWISMLRRFSIKHDDPDASCLKAE